MSSPSDGMVIGRQVIAVREQNIAYKSYTKYSGFQLGVESNRSTTLVLVFLLLRFKDG